MMDKRHISSNNIILINETEIKSRIDSFITELWNYHDLENCIFICVMNGAFMFYTDLVRKLPSSIKTDFIRVSSYGNNNHQSELTIKYLHDIDVKNQKVFIIDDILDSGNTLLKLYSKYKELGASEVYSISLLTRIKNRTVSNFSNHYTLFHIMDEWVYGYGLDNQGKYRNIPHVMYIEQNTD